MNKNKIVVVLIIIILFVVVFEILNKKFSYTSSNEDNVILPLTNEKFYVFNNDIFAFNNESVKLINSKEIIWEDSISTTEAYSIFKDRFLGISEKSGNFLNIYSNKGLLYTVNSVNNINSFTLNKNGYSAIITKGNNYYEIDAYDEQGNSIFGLKNISSTEGIPISCSISADNKFLAISFLQIDSVKVNSNISIYNLQDTSGDESYNNLFAAFLLENKFSGIIEFLDNSNLFVVSEKEVSLYKISENSSNLSWSLELNNKLKFVNIIDEKSFVLVYGDPINTNSIYSNNTVAFYNINGKETGLYTSDKNITNIEASLSSCIIQINRTLIALNNKGKVIWEYPVIQDLKQFSFFENTNKIITSSGNEVKILNVNKPLDTNSPEIENNSLNNDEDLNNIDENISDDNLSNEELDEDNTDLSNESLDTFSMLSTSSIFNKNYTKLLPP